MGNFALVLVFDFVTKRTFHYAQEEMRLSAGKKSEENEFLDISIVDEE